MIVVLPDSGYHLPMGQPADLYTILRFYANRIHNPVFPATDFIAFLEKYAQKYAPMRPDLVPWAADTKRKVLDGLPVLEEAGRCTLSEDQRGRLISISQYYVDLVQQAARTAENTPELPFWDEVSLKAVVPPSQLRILNLDMDFSVYLENPQGSPLPIIKLVFPDGRGTTLLLSGMIPKRLTEIALFKLRHYLRSHNNKEYLQHKLNPAFQGKETSLKEAMNMLVNRPLDAMSNLEQSGDFTFQFWAYLASLIKTDIRKKNELLGEDIAALQSIFILEILNNHYKGKAQKARDSETALKNLDLHFAKPPLYFTMDDIVRFSDSKGIPLLGQYDREALENYLKEKTTSGNLQELPELLTIHNPKGERFFILKTQLLPLCIKLLGEARPKVKTTLTQRWFKLMSDMRSDASMFEEERFNDALASLTEQQAPLLAMLLKEKTLYLVHEELAGTEAGIPEASRLFFKGALAPYSELYMLSRKALQTDVRMLLPFWYTIPVLSKIIAFFLGIGSGEKKAEKGQPAGAQADEPESRGSAETAKLRKKELLDAARRAEVVLVPEGYTMDSYLEHLEGHWNRLIGEAKDNLSEDVNALIRDYLRKSARMLKANTFTPDRIAELAASLAASPNLLKIPARDSLQTYIQVYMVKLVLKS